MDRVWLAALLFMLAGGMLGWYVRRAWVWWQLQRTWRMPVTGGPLTTTITVPADFYSMSKAEREARIKAALQRPE